MILNGQQIEPDRLYSAGDWANLSGLSPKTLAKQRSKLRGPAFIKFAGRVFYQGADLIEHLKGERHETGSNARRKLVHEAHAANDGGDA